MGHRKFDHYYLDAVPANTSYHLEIIRQLPISSYRLSYERSGTDRIRVGILGSDAMSIVPEAVEILPKHVLPPTTKTESPRAVTNMPVINENMLFYYGIGATQEICGKLDQGFETINQQIEHVSNLYGEVNKVEQLLKRATDGTAEANIRAIASKAKLAKAEVELELQRDQEDEAYTNALAKSEVDQIAKSEELVMQRLYREDEAARKRGEEYLKKKIETSQLVEQARMEAAEVLSAMEHERSLEIQRAKEKMKAETAKAVAAAKAEAERANEDVHLRRLQAESEQRQKRNIAAIQTIFVNLAAAFTAAADNPAKVLTFIGYITLFFSAVYTAREAARLCRILLEAALGKPKLVRETTRMSLPRTMLNNLLFFGRRERINSSKTVEDIFQDLILPGPLKSRVLTIAKSVRNAHRNKAPHRHMLLYGPPGTGKTLVAKTIAECVGMDYALMSGGDVGPLGSDAVTQIHSLFSWAKMSPKGVLLFVDEAEAFLGSRSKYSMSECAHNALNAILYNTGTERRDFMLILATNRADDLDAAILDRCDESLYFPCPDRACRIKLLSLYFEKFVKDIVKVHNERESRSKITHKLFLSSSSFLKLRIDDGVMAGEQLEEAAEETAGFSGREISKLMVALQSSFYASNTDGVLTKEDAWDVLLTKVQEHKEKKRMISGNEDVAIAASSGHSEVDNHTLSSSLSQTKEEHVLAESKHSYPADMSSGNKLDGGINSTVSGTQQDDFVVTEDSRHNLAATHLVSDQNAAIGNNEDRSTLISVAGESEVSVSSEDRGKKRITYKSEIITETGGYEEERRTTISASLASLMSLASPQDTDSCDPSLISTPLREDNVAADIIHRGPPQTSKLMDNKDDMVKDCPATSQRQKRRNGHRRRRMGVFC